jgi:CheY-like chemotaxis protein
VAHETNNQMTVVLGFAQHLLGATNLSPGQQRDLSQVQRAAERVAQLTRQLLALSRRQTLYPEALDLDVLVRESHPLMERLVGPESRIRIDLDPGPKWVRADRTQLIQVLLNLAINARDAMPDGGRLTIATRNVDLDSRYHDRHGRLRNGPHVLLAVCDTGVGMDADTQARIFEPFFTTKEQGKGTGLGLSTVYGIVKQGDGEIVVDTKPGRGSTFTIYFPRVPDEQVSEESSSPTGLHAGTETLLLVEDEPAIRALAGDILRRSGYKVLEARHGVEALLMGSQYLGAIHLLVTDVIMPQMSGSEVAERLMHERPHMKVLYISGYTDDAIIHHGVVQEGDAFLQKPFPPDALVQKVRQLLDSP